MFGKKLEETKEEITNRLKEAAEKGINPQNVVGFREIEENRNDSIKNGPAYILVKDICMALAKSGCKLSLANIEFDKRSYDSAIIIVYSNEGSHIGSISLCSNVKRFIVEKRESDGMFEYCEKRLKTGQLFYQIQSFPFLLIQSMVALPQDPPEWLMICANVIKKYSPGAVDPGWVREYPEAKKYINYMF
jgi:hypothetical protein